MADGLTKYFNEGKTPEKGGPDDLNGDNFGPNGNALLKALLSGEKVTLGAKQLDDGSYALNVYMKGLELTAEQVNLNTDGIEGLLGELKTLGSLFPLKGDETAATANTNVVTVSQAGIKYADLANPHKTITMYVWFGADPAPGSQIPLVPGASWSGPVDNKADMRYKSSTAGGVLDYVLRG